MLSSLIMSSNYHDASTDGESSELVTMLHFRSHSYMKRNRVTDSACFECLCETNVLVSANIEKSGDHTPKPFGVEEVSGVYLLL